MNNEYLFFYDREVIEYFCLDSDFDNKNIHKIDFMVGDINNRVDIYEKVPQIKIENASN
jgi:hypothetical protein